MPFVGNIMSFLGPTPGGGVFDTMPSFGPSVLGFNFSQTPNFSFTPPSFGGISVVVPDIAGILATMGLSVSGTGLTGPGGQVTGAGFTGGATGTAPGVLGLPETEENQMGFLDDIFGAIERALPIAQQIGLIPGPQPIIVNAGGGGSMPAPGQIGIPNVDLAAGIPGIDLQLPFRRELAPSVGAMRIAGTAPGFFHNTPTGQRRPNRVTLAADETGRMAFFVDAGRPTAWSKVSLKKSRPRHHHHRYRRPY